MRIAIVFYSFSGNTKRLSLFLKGMLEKKNHKVDMVEIKAEKEIKSFFRQVFCAFLKRKIPLEKVNINFDEFDLIIFATPVWAFTITPHLRTFLEDINLEGKKTACFVTFGSGAGAEKALKELENILKSKKGEVLFSLKIKDKDTEDKNLLQKLNLPL
ncbi:MAG: hypothetical protein B6D56_01845 [Candidatus Omnitrophica bacterium 4484_70.1]|nr:MAG: hypothetical protein B6D56_01845 [Candidatus Omnitrophica bacterium 4484_70.1]